MHHVVNQAGCTLRNHNGYYYARPSEGPTAFIERTAATGTLWDTNEPKGPTLVNTYKSYMNELISQLQTSLTLKARFQP